MDTNSFFTAACGFYKNSEIPTAVIKGKEIWENSRFARHFGLAGEGVREQFFSDIKNRKGINYEKIGNTLYTVNIVSSKEITVIEIISTEDAVRIFAEPRIRRFMKYIVSRVRGIVFGVNASTNVLYNMLSAENPLDSPKDAIDSLNQIEREMLSVVYDFIGLEQLNLLLDKNIEDTTVCVSDCVSSVIKGVKHFCKGINITLENCCQLFARLYRPALKMIITDTISGLYFSEHTPDKIAVGVFRSGSAGSITITADYSSGLPPHEDPRGCAPGSDAFFCREMFFRFVCKAFCQRYGGDFVKEEFGSIKKFSLSFPVIADLIEVCAPETQIDPGYYDMVSVRFNSGDRYRLPARCSADAGGYTGEKEKIHKQK